MRELWPTLLIVKERLGCAAPVHQIPSSIAAEAAAPVITPQASESLPALIQARIQQITGAKTLHADWPQPGMVIRIGKLGVCLNRPAGANNQQWSGWLTAPDTDYAIDSDVLLEEEDEPFDPYAAMVQTGHPVNVVVTRPLHVLAIISPIRLGAIRTVAAENMSSTTKWNGKKAEPGRIYLRNTDNIHRVLTGTPLGGNDDPRHEYRKLYRDAGAQLAHAPIVDECTLWQRLLVWLGSYRLPAVGVFATATLAVIVAAMLRPSDESTIIAPLAQAPSPRAPHPVAPPAIAEKLPDVSSAPSTEALATTPPVAPPSSSPKSDSLPQRVTLPPASRVIADKLPETSSASGPKAPGATSPMVPTPSSPKPKDLEASQLAEAQEVQDTDVSSPTSKKKVRTRAIVFDNASRTNKHSELAYLEPRDEAPMTERLIKDAKGKWVQVNTPAAPGKKEQYLVFRVWLADPAKHEEALDFLEALEATPMRLGSDNAYVIISTPRSESTLIRLESSLKATTLFLRYR